MKSWAWFSLSGLLALFVVAPTTPPDVDPVPRRNVHRGS